MIDNICIESVESNANFITNWVCISAGAPICYATVNLNSVAFGA